MRRVVPIFGVAALAFLAGCGGYSSAGSGSSSAAGDLTNELHAAGFDEAVALAKKNETLVMIDFYADW
ncbi:MAG: hypothetical protein IH851_06690 [Armatimonadetes bacterium]|nr:hypothetical protein [Armatimonadota bacterium]